MSSRRTRLVVAGVAALGVVGMALPAQAGDTSVTFTLTGGALTIAAPTDTATLTGGGLSLDGSAVEGALGTTTVSDQRGSVLGWTTTIAGTSFGNGTTTIPVGSAKAFVPGAVTPTGVVVASAGTYLTSATGLVLSTTAGTLVTGTGAVGVNGATFNPSISVAIPSNATAGTYSGTITQTVS